MLIYLLHGSVSYQLGSTTVSSIVQIANSITCISIDKNILICNTIQASTHIYIHHTNESHEVRHQVLVLAMYSYMYFKCAIYMYMYLCGFKRSLPSSWG